MTCSNNYTRPYTWYMVKTDTTVARFDKQDNAHKYYDRVIVARVSYRFEKQRSSCDDIKYFYDEGDFSAVGHKRQRNLRDSFRYHYTHTHTHTPYSMSSLFLYYNSYYKLFFFRSIIEHIPIYIYIHI